MHARDISRKLKEFGAKNGSARARSRRVLPYSANWPNWMYFGQGQDFKLTMELSEKVLYCHNQAIKNSFYEAIMLMSKNEALLS